MESATGLHCGGEDPLAPIGPGLDDRLDVLASVVGGKQVVEVLGLLGRVEERLCEVGL